MMGKLTKLTKSFNKFLTKKQKQLTKVFKKNPHLAVYIAFFMLFNASVAFSIHNAKNTHLEKKTLYRTLEMRENEKEQIEKELKTIEFKSLEEVKKLKTDLKKKDSEVKKLKKEVVAKRQRSVATVAVATFSQPAAIGYAGTGGELTGEIGYAIAYGNCVNTAKAHGKNQPGNPISWTPSTQTPFIGAAALWHYNHVGIVVGIWSNGDLEIAHENFPGGQHRFPRSEFRGFF